jgi:hypothetical protein
MASGKRRGSFWQSPGKRAREAEQRVRFYLRENGLVYGSVGKGDPPPRSRFSHKFTMPCVAPAILGRVIENVRDAILAPSVGAGIEFMREAMTLSADHQKVFAGYAEEVERALFSSRARKARCPRRPLILAVDAMARRSLKSKAPSDVPAVFDTLPRVLRAPRLHYSRQQTQVFDTLEEAQDYFAKLLSITGEQLRKLLKLLKRARKG